MVVNQIFLLHFCKSFYNRILIPNSSMRTVLLLLNKMYNASVDFSLRSKKHYLGDTFKICIRTLNLTVILSVVFILSE